MSRPFNFAEGEFYHLYNRGTEKRDIFLTERDYRRFTALLFLSNGTNAVNLEETGHDFPGILTVQRGEPLLAVGAYCLMPNHFHILACEITKGGISKFMQKVATGYTMYFNQINDRTGSLFQGKFKAEHAAEDPYLKYLFAYIHLNPAKLVDPQWREKGVRGSTVTYVQEYQHSSYRDYSGDQRRDEASILSKDKFPDYFSTPEKFEFEMNEWLNFSRPGTW